MANKIQFRRGTDAERQEKTFDSGEPAWATDTKKLYVGDGETKGGVLAGIRNWLGLTDTPSSYAGQKGKYPRVKTTEDGLELAEGTVAPVDELGTPPDYIEVAGDGFLTLHGDARTSGITTLACENWYPTHHNPLGIKEIADGGTYPLDVSELEEKGSAKRILIYGVGEGIHCKLKADSNAASPWWSIKDKTHEAVMSFIELYPQWGDSWEQTTPCKIKINIAVGDVTGWVTIYLPSFSLDSEERLVLCITDDGATYYGYGGGCTFEHFAAGPSAAEENLTSDVAAGDSVVCPVADTTGFFIGGKARLVDDNNAEWTRITAIITNTSITVAHLDYGYTTAANVKIKKVNCTRTTYGAANMRRGMGRICCLPPDVPSGVSGHLAFPFSIDLSAPLRVALVIAGKNSNPGSKTVRMRLQYVPTGPGDNALSEQWGKMRYINVTPALVAGDFVETLFTGGFVVPSSEILNKKAIQLQVCRMGDDAVNDTYEGCIYLVAVLIGTTQKHFGYDYRT